MPPRTEVPKPGDPVWYTDAEGHEYMAIIVADVTGEHPTDLLADLFVMEGDPGEALVRRDVLAVPYREVSEPVSWR